MQELLPYIIGALVCLVIVGTLVYAFTRPDKQRASDTEIALMGATGGLAGAGEAAEVAELAAAEAAPAKPEEPVSEPPAEHHHKHNKVVEAYGMTDALRH